MNKKIESSNEKCANCGGNLHFSPLAQDLACENCGSHFDVEITCGIEEHDLNASQKNSAEYEKFVNENKMFKCPNCGANVVLNKLEIAQKCPYCATGLVASESQNTGLKPDAIIPFAFNEDEAGKRFQRAVKKKFFAPSKFKKQVPENEIKGIYIPSYAFSADTTSSYSGQLYNTHTETDNEGRSHTEYEYFIVSGTFDASYDDIMVECSSHINQRELGGFLPFRMADKMPYANGFIMGYSVEKYDREVNDCVATYRSIAQTMIRSDILRKYSYDGVSYLNIQTNYSNEKFQYDILPVYRFEYDYKNKKYVTYMNGQTGKIDDNFPKSALKIALAIMLPLLIVLIPIIIGIITSIGNW